MVKTVCRYLFSSSRNKEEKHWGTLKKNSSNFEQRERKYSNTWGGRGRARGQKSLQNHFFCIYNNLFSFCFHCHTLLKLKLNCEFAIVPLFWTVKNFALNYRQLLNFRMR